VTETTVPTNLAAACRADGRAMWLAELPKQIDDIASRWSLALGDPFEPGGVTAWVAPASSPDFGNVVLKIGSRHMEGEDEAAGLRAWDGDGAVRVFVDERLNRTTTAMLLERCVPGTTLSEYPEKEQDVVISGLLQRLWRIQPDGRSFRPLQEMCDHWADGFERKLAEGRAKGTDPGIAREGVALFRTLPLSASDERLLCTDLHAENVLASGREPWLVIDPKPFFGDTTYDALQHHLNSKDRLVSHPEALAARMAGLLGLEFERLLVWLFAYCVVQSVDFPWLLGVAEQIRP
jgi:streptomycin 6-kinase